MKTALWPAIEARLLASGIKLMESKLHLRHCIKLCLPCCRIRGRRPQRVARKEPFMKPGGGCAM
jgi:hypothetical protein